MIRGIHFYFSTELKTKIYVIPRGCFKGPYPGLKILKFKIVLYVLYKIYIIYIILRYVHDKCVFRNVHIINSNSLYYNGFDQAAGGLDEGCDVELFFL